MFRSLMRPAFVRRPGWMVLGIVVGVLASDVVGAAQPAPAAQAEPAKNPFMFMSDGSLLINYVKPDKTADFEMVMGKVKEALAKSDKPERKEQAEGWKVFKTDLPGPSGAVTYFAIVDPVDQGRRLQHATDPRRGVRRGRHQYDLQDVSGQRRRPAACCHDAHAEHEVVASELQIQPCVEAVRWRVQRTVSQFEHPVVHAQPQRSRQRHLHAAPTLVPNPVSWCRPSVSR